MPTARVARKLTPLASSTGQSLSGTLWIPQSHEVPHYQESTGRER
jgi:hypothetical protein